MNVDRRTGIEILETDTCWDLLAAAPVGRLAVSIAGHPDIFPVNHVVDRRSVVFRTAEGTKLAASVLGLSVAFEVDGWSPGDGDVWSVVLKGHAAEVEGLEDLMATDDLPLYPWSASVKHRVVRITPTEITGRRFHAVDDAQGLR
jgi:nitroimidazol reductase NimA-like FMN-containing flavoprotein (pyridoxamine 5'-phosphate oxidase superfamily)